MAALIAFKREVASFLTDAPIRYGQSFAVKILKIFAGFFMYRKMW